ncbi:MAG: ACT domain-containing protein [Terrisporobacter sp.]|uniref:ACT domain-containing protein n=1 Tax=Terrisporobacter sp. TaxID=1965305 RepID=UPI002FC890FA
MNKDQLTLKLLDRVYAVCRLDKGQPVEQWALEGDFSSITKTEDEISLVCLDNKVPSHIKHEGNLRTLKIEGPLDFSLVGILSKISTLMSNKNIPIFAMSTYDTDYILIKNDEINKAIEILEQNNYNVI